MMRFGPRVDDQRPGTSPVLMTNKRGNAINIMGRIAARKGHPEEIIYLLSDELTVVGKHDKRYAPEFFLLFCQCVAERTELGGRRIIGAELRSGDNHNSGKYHLASGEAARKI